MRGVGKDYPTGEGRLTVLDSIDLDIMEGEFLAIVGQSGSGKSTLMHLLGALDRPSRGTYELDGASVTELSPNDLAALRRDTVGFVFQRYHLVSHATAAENVEVPALYAGQAPATRRARATALLDRLGLSDRLHHRPGQLSGGQQQRVSIARALMNGGRLVLADEPTGALDSASGRQVMTLLAELHRAGHTVVLVTHDEGIAAQAGRRIHLRDGRIVSDSGSANLAPGQLRPASTKVEASQFNLPQQSSFLHDLVEAMRLARHSLRMHLLRTGLTLLGIVIGVASVVAMLALGDGSKAQVLSRIEAMGTDLLVVRPGARNVRSREERASLVSADAEAIGRLSNVRRVLPEYSGPMTLRGGGNDLTTTVVGTGADYALARQWPLAAGSFFESAHERSAAPVLVLGQTVARQLFGDPEDALGNTVLAGNVPLRVIGVLATKGANASGNDQDDVAYLPLSTGRMRLFGKSYLRSITVQVEDSQQGEAVQEHIRRLLIERHGKEDFNVRNTASLLETASQTQNTMALLLGSIAAISLLVGGIGVMNIMLVSVTERVREIGIRRACGACMRHIMLQFNIEALLVCVIGGLVGVAVGLAAAWTSSQFGAAVLYRWPPVALALGSAMAIGLLFGYLPARRAARLDPVLALSAD
jgi:macrolide transport system ATP-binding/permease protein